MKNLRNFIPVFITFLTFLPIEHAAAQESSFAMTQDSNFERLLNEKRRVNNTFSIYKNYSLQLYFGAREEAEARYHDFKKSFPAIDATIIYSNPNYKLVVGNYKNKIEAENTLRKLQKKYPNIFIVKLRP